MNWKLKYLLFPLFLVVVLFHANAQKHFTNGIAAYNNKDYSLAATEFEKVIASDEKNVSAWYNLGLSNIGKKAYGEAILDFEKVLKFMPNDSEAETKIEYCFGELHPEIEWSPRLNSFQSSLFSLSLNAWGLICISLSLACAIGLILYMQQKKSSLKSAFIFINIFLISSFVASLLVCSNLQDFMTDDSFAVVNSKSIPTFIDNSPSPKTTILEGTRVEVIEKKKNDFVKVRTLTGEIHVVRAKELSFI